MVTYEDIQKANETIRTTDIKGKDYAEVNQRVKAFRMVYPEGFITTEMVSNEDGVCIFKATVGYYNYIMGKLPAQDEDGCIAKILGTGTAYEKEGSTFINKTSYIENCETSAVGRALGMAGFGIDTSVASAEEVQNAMANQEKKASPKQLEILHKVYQGELLDKLLKKNKLDRLEDISMTKASDLIGKLKEKEKEQAKLERELDEIAMEAEYGARG